MTSSSWSNLALVVVILVILASPEARSDGLVITVINEKHLGVVSSIIAKHDTEETIVGTTLPSGRLPSNKYKCSEDRSLIARPLDRSYFESPPAPCESPQNFLVTSRITPNGDVAFANVAHIILFSDGNVGQYNLKSSIKPVIMAEKDHCVVSYDIQVEKGVFKYINNDWVKTSASEEPAQLTTNDNSKLVEEFEKKGISVITKEPFPKLAIDKNCDSSSEELSFIQNSFESTIKRYLAQTYSGDKKTNEWTAPKNAHRKDED